MSDPNSQKSDHIDLAAIKASLDALSARLSLIESADQPSLQTAHPSLDKLQIAEAIADSIFSHYKKEKACQFEPDKPCDHCSMCNSRGF